MHNKPTSPFSFISFTKLGKVVKHVLMLSSDKSTQEKQAAESFMKAYNKRNQHCVIKDCSPLPENDQDFVLTFEHHEVLLQLTELVDRAFTKPMTNEEYDKVKFQESILKKDGDRPWKIDVEKRDAALSKLIEKKLDKHYAKEADKKLWLLIFTTNTLYEVEYKTEGKLIISNSLQKARLMLEKKQENDFQEIWFTNLLTSPIQIWPAT